ncbi:MAG: DoxX family protein [Saprospiraceae bacterium]|nr:DoxX family protein [Saprospiraceae bacterium]
MLIKTILIALLGVFFILNGINHFYNEKMLEEYAEKRGLFSPQLAVRLAGILLIGGGVALMIEEFRVIGVLSLSFFLLMATFTIHRFWEEKDKYDRMLELMNFAKNLAILTELVYIGFV